MQTNYAGQNIVIVYDAGSLTKKIQVVRLDAYKRVMRDIIDTYDKLIAQKDEEIRNLKADNSLLTNRFSLEVSKWL